MVVSITTLESATISVPSYSFTLQQEHKRTRESPHMCDGKILLCRAGSRFNIGHNVNKIVYNAKVSKSIPKIKLLRLIKSTTNCINRKTNHICNYRYICVCVCDVLIHNIIVNRVAKSWTISSTFWKLTRNFVKFQGFRKVSGNVPPLCNPNC